MNTKVDYNRIRLDYIRESVRKSVSIVQRSQDYDGFARLKTIDVTNHADNPILNYAYQYDNAHNIIQHQTTQQRQADSQHPKSYEYDEADRLITVTQNNTQTMSWQYDDNSNRIQQNKDNRQQQYHYNANQELIEISSDDQTTYYQYDPNGALIEQSGSNPRTYQYNSYGRLAAVIENEQTIASYGYNVFGQRTSKTINDLTTYYHYSEQGLESEYNEQGELMQGYYYSPQNSLGNAPVAIKHNDNGITQTSYYQNDHLNTPQMLTRPNGAIVWQGQYDAFGEVTQTNTQVSNPLRFPGQYQDDETGLHYNWYRYYDNSIGRYVTSDPIGLDGGLNTYGYVYGNPLKYFDPYGLYGTASCEYYREACKEGGGYYACVARYICPLFPEGEEDDWWQCVRQCLQEEHNRRDDFPNDSCRIFDNPYTDHTTCFTACGVNSSNPGVPSN